MKKKLLFISLIVFLFAVPFPVQGITGIANLNFNSYAAVDSSEVIDSTYFIYWKFGKDIPNAYLDVFMVNEGNYSRFLLNQSYSRYDLALPTDPSAEGTFDVPFEDLWYFVMHNVDSPLERSIAVSYTIVIDEKHPKQNDGNSGGDAGNTAGAAYLLGVDDYNSSGMLIYDDYVDFYKVYTEENDLLRISISGLYDSNCQFEVQEPYTYNSAYTSDAIYDDFIVDIPIHTPGFWVLKFEKLGFSPIRETYFINVQINPVTTSPSFSPTSPIGLPSLPFLLLSFLSLFSILFSYSKRKSGEKPR